MFTYAAAFVGSNDEGGAPQVQPSHPEVRCPRPSAIHSAHGISSACSVRKHQLPPLLLAVFKWRCRAHLNGAEVNGEQDGGWVEVRHSRCGRQIA